MDTKTNVKEPKRRERAEGRFDYTLLLVVMFLLGFGMIMIYSASAYDAALQFDGNATYYLVKQLQAVGIGLVVMMITVFIPVSVWEKRTITWYVLGLVSLFLLLTPLAHTANGATRWLRFGPLSFQPAEAVKLCMILFYANVVCKMGKALGSLKGFIIAFLLPAPMAACVYFISDNLSSAIIIYGIAVVMLLVACPNVWYPIGLVGGGALLVSAVVGGILLFGKPDQNFRFGRIFAWIHPENYPDGAGFQTLQSLYAIGSGGVFGKGLGQSIQKLKYIPEAQNDMIFSVLCEELGMFGAFSVMLLFIILFWRCMVIANRAKDLYSSMLVVGILGHLAIQVLLNIAVSTNTIPNTGVSLPFISYGGSSVLFLLIEVGLLLSISRNR